MVGDNTEGFIGSKTTNESKTTKEKPEIEKIQYTGSCPACKIFVKQASATRKKGKIKLDNCKECSKRKTAYSKTHPKSD